MYSESEGEDEDEGESVIVIVIRDLSQVLDSLRSVISLGLFFSKDWTTCRSDMSILSLLALIPLSSPVPSSPLDLKKGGNLDCLHAETVSATCPALRRIDHGPSSELLFQILAHVPLHELFRRSDSVFHVSKQWFYMFLDPAFWHALCQRYIPDSAPDMLRRKMNHMTANYCKLRLERHCSFEQNLLQQVCLLSMAHKPLWSHSHHQRQGQVADPLLMPWLTFDWLSRDAVLPTARTAEPTRLSLIFPVDATHWATLVPGDCGALIFDPQQGQGQVLVSLPSISYQSSGIELESLDLSPLLPLIASTRLFFVTVTRTGVVRLWHQSSGLVGQTLTPALCEEASCLCTVLPSAATRGAELIVCGTIKGTLSVWMHCPEREGTGFHLLLQLGLHEPISSLCLVSFPWLVVCSWDRSVFLVHLLASSVVRVEALWDESPVTCIRAWPDSWRKDGRRDRCAFAVGLESGGIFVASIWLSSADVSPPSSISLTRALRGHCGPVTCLEFESIFGQYLISSALDSTIRVWSSASGQCLAVYALVDSPVWGFRFYYGRMFASTTRHRLLQFSFLPQMNAF